MTSMDEAECLGCECKEWLCGSTGMHQVVMAEQAEPHESAEQTTHKPIGTHGGRNDRKHHVQIE